MSCEYCTMGKEWYSKSHGKYFEDEFSNAAIFKEYDEFSIYVEGEGIYHGVTIKFCPWCGKELGDE